MSWIKIKKFLDSKDLSNRKILAFAFIATVLYLSLICHMKFTIESIMGTKVPSTVTNLRVQ